MKNAKLFLTSLVRRNESSLSAEVDNSLVLMSIDKGNYYSLDAIGSDIWQRIDGQVAVADLCTALEQEYDADAETIRRDVLALLERLVAENLIEICA